MPADSTPDLLDNCLFGLTASDGLVFAVGCAWVITLAWSTRRQASVAAALEIAQCQLRQAVRSGGIAPFVFDLRSRRVVGGDSEIARLLGHENRDRGRWPLTDRDLMRRVHGADRPDWIAALREMRSTGVLDQEARFLCADGATVHLVVWLEMKSASQGKPGRLIGVARDMTPMRRMEHELDEHRNQRVHLARASHIGEMAAAIGHELRNPLMAIEYSAKTAQTYLATLPLLRAKLMEQLADIVRSGEQATAIIHRVHARTRRKPGPFQILRVNEVVREAVRDVQHVVAVTRTTVVLRLGDRLPEVRGDLVQLRQLLVNLVVNAAEAMAALPEDRRSLTIATHADSPCEVGIAVIDRGPGIDAAVYQKLFLPFNTSKPEGLGIGLSICRGIASAHHATLSGTNNDDGCGATFTLTLPGARSRPAAESGTDEIAPDHLRR